jgi:hypothetical protein
MTKIRLGVTHGTPETGFLRESVGNNEVFSSKNPVSLVGCVNPDYDFA